MFAVTHAEERDAEVVHNLVQTAFAEYIDNLPVPAVALSDTLEITRREVAEGHTLLAREGTTGRPIGTARYYIRPDHLYVERVAVLPRWRRRGVGRVLMEAVEGIACGLGIWQVRLGTRQSIPGNLVFYGKLGYKAVRREKHARGPDVIVWFEKEVGIPPAENVTEPERE